MRILKILLISILLSSLSGCNSNNDLEIISSYDNVEAYKEYLRIDEDKECLAFYYYNDEDESYIFELDNEDDKNYSRAILEVYDEDNNLLYKSNDYYLIRPNDYYILDSNLTFEKEPYDYVFVDNENYQLIYDEGLDYEYHYNYDNNNYYLGIVFDGKIDDNLALRIAKKEYVIGVLTDYLEPNIYLFNSNSLISIRDNKPSIADSDYFISIDYDNKEIKIYKSGSLIKTETME